MLEYINPELIYLNFSNKWFAVDPEAIYFDEFTFPNIPDDCFGTFLIKDRNGNKGISVVSSKIIKEINARKLLNDSNEFSPKHQYSKSFERYEKKMMKRYTENISKGRTGFLKSVCPDAPLCISFGKQKEKIMKHFNGFKDFKYAVSVTGIGRKTINGFVKLIKYERDGYKASAILKSANKKDSDNLLFEYLVGQYINKQCLLFSCFVETYAWYQYKTEEDWLNMKSNRFNLDKEVLNSLVIGKVALENYISSPNGNICFENKKEPSSERECIEIELILKLACAKSKQISLLTQHIQNGANIEIMLSQENFCSHDLLNVLYQIYMPLATLSDTFTHYDLKSDNLLVYEPDTEKYIDYKYVMNDESVVMFKCRYMAKIIDYGRCFFDDKSNKEISSSSKSIYETICKNIQECNGDGFPLTYCGEERGFSNFDISKYGLDYYINSAVPNITHDLKLLYTVKKELKDVLPHISLDPLLQTIFDRLEYGDEVKLEAEQLRTGKLKYEHGSEEKSTTGVLIDGIPDKINNVIDAHNALKTQILKNKEANDALYETMTSLGELTIYESEKPMEFKPIIKGLVI